MPVTSITLAAVAALVLMPVFVQAQQRVIIKHAYQLERAPQVKATGDHYEALAAGYVLYNQCAKELNISDAQKTYLTDKFTKVARQYQIDYQDAYVTYVGSSPSQALVNDIAATIKKKQQQSVNSTALRIRKQGCTSDRFGKLLNYIKKLEAADAAPPPDPTTLEPVAKFGKK